MAYGIVSKGHNGFLGINSDWPSLVFVGKATWTGTGSVFPADHQSYQWVRNFGPYQPGSSEGPISGTGVKQFYVRAETLNCGSYTATLTTPNDNGIFQYVVDAPNYPHIFCSTSRVDVTISVLGIRNTGQTGANGWPRWAITASIVYPTGMRATAVQYVTMYCFSNTYSTSESSVGVRAFNADSVLVFNSELNPIRIKNMLTITSTTLPNPSDLSSLLINDTPMDNPVAQLSEIVKPAFLNVDWARYVVSKVQALGKLFRLVYYPIAGVYVCELLTTPAISYSQTFISAGVRLAADKTSRVYSLHGLDAANGSIIVSSTSSTSISKLESLPVYIPIIDGAEYD